MKCYKNTPLKFTVYLCMWGFVFFYVHYFTEMAEPNGMKLNNLGIILP